AGAGGHRGWSGPHRILQGLSLRHGGPSLLHQGRRGAEDLAAGPRLGLPAASAPVADLLRRAVLPLSTQAAERAGRPGSLARPARRAELSALATLPLHGGADLRAVGDESLRPPSLPDVLQDLHREGVGHSVLRAGGGGRRGAEGIEIRGPGRRVDGGVVTGPRGEEPVRGDQFLSSMPVTELVLRLSPPAPDAVREAARRLTYRDFLTVCLIVNRPDPFPDNWIYVHSPEVQVGRIQNFRSWSPDMVPEPGTSSLGLEYFCREGDALWTMPDADLIPLGKRKSPTDGCSAGPRPIRSTMPAIATRSTPCGNTWTGSRICRPLAATACTATTTRTTPCSPGSWPSAISWITTGTISGAAPPTR